MDPKKMFFTYNGFPRHAEWDHFVDWNEFKLGKGNDIIYTDSVAVCLAITLYYPPKKLGVLAHISDFSDSPTNLRSENVIDTLLQALGLTGKQDTFPSLQASLAGEGLLRDDDRKLSPIVRSMLNKYDIPIIGEDLCKAPGRLVYLHCDTGLVEVFRAG